MKNTCKIDLPKEECMEQVATLLKENERITILKKTSSSIKFERKSSWTFKSLSETSRIIATIDFEENGKTKMKTHLNSSDILPTDLIIYVAASMIFVLFIVFTTPILQALRYISFLNGEISRDSYVTMYYTQECIKVILIPLIPIIFTIEGIIEYLHYKPKGLIEIMENVNSTLSPSLKKDEVLSSRQSLSEENKIIIKDHVKVIFDLPEKCPICSAPLKYEHVKMKGPMKAECGYCNSMFDLIEKEI